MTTEVGFSLSNIPAHARNSKSQAMQAMASGMSGGFGNRISLRGNRFRIIQNGSDLGALQSPTLDVVIFAMANSVQRFYFEGVYEPGSKDRPTCFSVDGKVPSDESPKKQSATCAICPQNVKGSARQGGGKACAYKKRVVVLSADGLEDSAYSLDVNGQSMFGDQQEAQNRFSFKGYYEKLSVHNVDIAAIVTRLSFDDTASVPKLHFTPVRALTEEEYAQVQARMNDEQVQLMLKDLTNEEEHVEPSQKEEPQAAAKPKVEAPAPTPAVAAPKETKKQFATTAASPGNGGTTMPPPAKKPLQIDLTALTTFDD